MAHITPQVETLLRNNNLIHLATCKDNVPSASLMNFTYIDAEDTWHSTESSKSVIVMATPLNTQKHINIVANPNVSLLIHDWVTGSKESNGLASYLQRLNQSALSQRSATLQGKARIVSGDEADFYRAKHLSKHEDAECFIKNAEIFVVEPTSVRLADALNHVETY